MEAGGRDATLDRELVRLLLAWFAAHARPLPWRESGAAGARDPYRTLVSELMLQQTQVSRVLEKFEAFLARFPTVHALAAAPQSDVLAAWSGLGYYRRAKLLHGAAQGVVSEFGGVFPKDAASLRTLPGIGRYTAGAVSSLAFGAHEPLVDGNVTRVLLRVSARPGRLADKETDAWAWKRATELLASVPGGQAGSWNEGLMELGATVCLPAGAKCESCPLRSQCGAYADGAVETIPAPKVMKKRVRVFWATVVIRDPVGRYLIKTRPATGLFAGMAEAPTLESAERASAKEVRRFARDLCGQDVEVRKVGSLGHQLTHRQLVCDVYAGNAADVIPTHDGEWIESHFIPGLSLSNIQRKIIALAGAK